LRLICGYFSLYVSLGYGDTIIFSLASKQKKADCSCGEGACSLEETLAVIHFAAFGFLMRMIVASPSGLMLPFVRQARMRSQGREIY